ncbi:MAG: hypothetical protein Q7W16_07600 [Coriobacteriia bacterium]|nr:hypothetical protein [Coriobacteriia bacterium]
MKRSIQILMVVAVAATIVLTSVVPAFARLSATGTSAECARCHSPRAKIGAPVADFTAVVNYSKCKSCHWLKSSQRIGTYYKHSHGLGSNCAAAGCHAGYGAGPARTVMSVPTAYGYFSTSNWSKLSAAQLHAIHVRGSWPQSGTKSAACASCHAPAACDACHVAPATHSGHAYNATNRAALYAPVSALMTRGTPINNASAVTARVQATTCTNAKCHVVSADGATIATPTCGACHVAPVAARMFFAAPAPVAKKAPVRVR